MKKILLGAAFLMSSSVYAELQPLDNHMLEQVEGQGGADISLQLGLNQDSTYKLNCADLVYCRLGLSLNNRNHDGTITGSATGKKLWLVFKGIQGTINLQKVALDGADLTYGSTVKPAIQLTYDPLLPIQIRNFGYQALSIETDTVANEGAGNVPGYLATSTYAYNTGTFDGNNPNYPAGVKINGATGNYGRETGFTGLNMHGNLSLAGTVKIFSCDGTHPRC